MLSPKTLDGMIKNFDTEIERLNPNTAQTYKRFFHNYLKHSQAFTTKDIRTFLDTIKSKSTYGVYWSALRWFYKINAEEFDNANIKIYFESIIPPRATETFNPIILPPNEIHTIINNAPTLLKKTMLKTGYELCLRVTELAELHENDYNTEKKTMYVTALKHGISRDMPIPEELNTELIKYLEWKHEKFGKSNRFFLTEWGNDWLGKSFSYKFFRRYIITLYEKKMISAKPNYHSFARHCRITHWLQEGVDFFIVNSLARHRSFDTTLRYAHLAPNDLIKNLPSSTKKTFGIGL